MNPTYRGSLAEVYVMRPSIVDPSPADEKFSGSKHPSGRLLFPLRFHGSFLSVDLGESLGSETVSDGRRLSGAFFVATLVSRNPRLKRSAHLVSLFVCLCPTTSI